MFPMKIKMIYSNFDENTGISEVIIMTDIGEFKGTSKLHEEDRNISSHFAGCRYAEMKAIIKYMKQKIKNIQMQIKGLEDFQSNLATRADYNYNSIENSKARRRIFELKKQIISWNKKIDSLTARMLDMMTQREEIIKTIRKDDK